MGTTSQCQIQGGNFIIIFSWIITVQDATLQQTQHV